MSVNKVKAKKRQMSEASNSRRKFPALLGIIVAAPVALWLMKPSDAPDPEIVYPVESQTSWSAHGPVSTGDPTVSPAPTPTSRSKMPDGEVQFKNLREQLARELDDPLAAALFGLGDDKSFAGVSAAAERMFDRGGEADAEALFRYLETPLTAALDEQEWQAMQRRIVDYLVMEWPQHERAQDHLLALFENPQTQPSVRSAVARRLDKLYQRSAAPEVITEALWSSAAVPGDDIASASLVALARINAKSDGVDTARLRDTATEIASDGRSSVMTKVTAMEIATWLGSPRIYTQAKHVIKEDNMPTMLQLAAIATIMKSGDASNIDALEELAENRPYPVNKAAAEAIKRLNGG